VSSTSSVSVPGLRRMWSGTPYADFPNSILDEELTLATGSLTPSMRERVVRLATWMSVVRAGRELAHLTGVTVGGTTVRRLTERGGRCTWRCRRRR